jgi:uncharacterized ion transporter superfamily protein YfcC
MKESEMTPDQRAADPSVEPAEEKASAFPSALTILAIVIVLVWIATFFIPAGSYQSDEDGRPIPGSFERTDRPIEGFRDNVENLLLSPINGLYGIEDLETGQVGPFNSGVLFGSAQVFLFILAIGGFMTVVFATGALDRGIALLAHRFKARGAVLIVVLSLLFGLLGSVMTWSDETLGFYALMIPLFLALDYDRLVTVAVVTVAPFVGAIGSTVTPFRIGIGSDAAGISIGDGIGLRIVLLVLCMTAMIVYTLRYASRVRADPSASLVGIPSDEAEIATHADSDRLEPLTGRQKIVLVLTAGTFILLTFSIVPWGSILNNTLVDPETHETTVEAFSWELGWWLPELTAMFIVMALVVGLVGGLGEAGIAGNFMKGVVDFTGPAFLVAFARAVAVILTNTQTLDTTLNAMEDFVSGRSEFVFVLLMALVSLPLGFLVGSGSAGMALVMPILAPLGDFAGLDRSLIVTTYNAMGAWLNLVLPTNAILIAGLVLAKVRFDVYLRFIWPLMAILLAIILAVLLLGAAF